MAYRKCGACDLRHPPGQHVARLADRPSPTQGNRRPRTRGLPAVVRRSRVRRERRGPTRLLPGLAAERPGRAGTAAPVCWAQVGCQVTPPASLGAAAVIRNLMDSSYRGRRLGIGTAVMATRTPSAA